MKSSIFESRHIQTVNQNSIDMGDQNTIWAMATWPMFGRPWPIFRPIFWPVFMAFHGYPCSATWPPLWLATRLAMLFFLSRSWKHQIKSKSKSKSYKVMVKVEDKVTFRGRMILRTNSCKNVMSWYMSGNLGPRINSNEVRCRNTSRGKLLFENCPQFETH